MRKYTLQISCWRWLGTAAAAIALATPITHVKAADPLPLPQAKDKVQSRVGVLRGGSLFTPDAGGHTGKAGDYAVDFGMGTGPVYVQEAAFLNDATKNDEMSFLFWIKKYDIANNSAFWAYSPSSSQGGRGWQAHVPWSNNNIYFDTAGCCDGATQRINAPIADFPGYGDIDWWTNNWHFFVFSKKAEVKQVWIDGILFLEGTSTAPLPTDMTELYIGAQTDGVSLIHGLIDDFAVFGAALSEATIGQLFSGTLPSALPASDKLMAYWDFNDYPAEGQFISVSPAPNAMAAAPNLVQVVHIDGATPWDQSNVTLKVDDVPAAPTFTRDGKKVTLKYVPSSLLAMQSKHKVALTFPGAGGASQTVEWQFTVAPYTRDVTAARVGVFVGGSAYTGDAGGHTGKSGDYAVDFGRGTGPVYVPDGTFLNNATVNDEMTFAFWTKKYDIANSSAFWAVSPSSSSNRRGFQAHVPWSNNNIYFDTAGCCDGTTQRINAPITDFPNYTDLTWWTDQWHFFVFSKKAEVKQIWIDGVLFLEGSSTAPLPTDMIELLIGSETMTGNLVHGLMDDFAVFGAALSEAAIGQLFAGTLPTALPASDKLMAYWNFNDLPAEGLFLSFTPTPDSTNAVPNLVKVVHLQGISFWDLNKVSLKVDNAPVTASAVRNGSLVTVSYVPSPIFAPKSAHTAALTYPLPGGDLASRSWQFTVGLYTKDVLHQYVGVLTGPAQYTADSGGQSGKPGDYGIDFGRNNAGQSVHILDATFLNVASTNDEMAVAAWQKLYQVTDSSLFWGISPTTGNGNRGFQVHTPWSNNNLYFDTAGCCDAILHRINAPITDFPAYTGNVSWWQDWHHLVVQKKASTKEIWIDGALFLTGENSNPLPTDFTEAWLGFDPPDNATLRGIIDDFAAFKTALIEADIVKLATGTRPTALPAQAGLLAYWDFNDAPLPVPPRLIVTRSGGNVTITSEPQPLPAGFVLQTALSVLGPWTTQAGANTPITVPIGNEAAMFLRAFKP
jgi:hypothetical protein